MYAQTEDILYYPKSKDFWSAQEESDRYAREKANGRKIAGSTKVYGWCWCISYYI